MDNNTILRKYDNIPDPQDAYEKAQLESAKTACRLLKKVSTLSQRTQANLCLSILSLCRRARLITEERISIFGQGFLEQQLFERVLDRDQRAIVLAMLEAIDKKKYNAAAHLARDIVDWEDNVEGQLDDFLLTHSTDAAILCLLAARLGNIPFEDFDLKDMLLIVKQQHPPIGDFFELL